MKIDTLEGVQLVLEVGRLLGGDPAGGEEPLVPVLARPAVTRRASSRSGVTSAAVAPGVSSLRRSNSATVTASSCGLMQS